MEAHLKGKPILFSGPMIRALLAGTKMQTRRVLKPQPRHGAEVFCNGGYWYAHTKTGPGSDCVEVDAVEPRYAVGDRLYVREMWARVPASAYRMSDGVPQTIDPNDPDMAAIYAADWERSKPKWKPSIHMPRWASRLTLTVTDVRVERLQDISEADAQDEGCDDGGLCRPVFRRLWDSLNADRGYGWDANPWVAAYTFTVQNGNIDQIEPSPIEDQP